MMVKDDRDDHFELSTDRLTTRAMSERQQSVTSPLSQFDLKKCQLFNYSGGCKTIFPNRGAVARLINSILVGSLEAACRRTNRCQ